MTVKVTAIFKSTGLNAFPDSGFSESFYLAGTDLPSAIGVANVYAQKRAPLGNESTSIVAVRATIVGQKGQSIVQTESGLDGNFEDPDTPWQAVWTTIRTTSGLKRQFMLRGMTDDFIVNEDWVPSSSWTVLFGIWKAFLTSTPLLLIGRDRSNAFKVVTTVDGAGLVTTSTAHGLAPGNPVKFYRTFDTDGKGVAGIWYVATTPTSTTFSVSGWESGRLVFNGQVFLYGIATDSINDVAIEGVRKRQVGRPFGQLRGRLRRRRR